MKKWVLAFLLCYSSTSIALVDMKNANFSDYWVDMIAPGNPNTAMRIARTYSSRSLFSGIFGFGWCSNLETQIEITLEGNLILSDCDSSPTAYYPAKYNTQLINDSVEKIISLVSKKYPDKDKKALNTMRDQLRSDHLLRTQVAGEVGYKITPVKNTVYFANGKEIDQITFDGTYFVHALPDGGTRQFDEQGKLFQLSDKSKNFIRITYQANLPSQIVDNAGSKFTFQYTPEKKIKKIIGMNGASVTYKFRGEDLVGINNAWKNAYTYTYDNNHNLTRISFPDGTYKAISYVEVKDWVREFRDRDGCVETYEFVLSSDNPRDHYSSHSTKRCNNKVQHKSRYEFWYQARPDKEKYLSRVLSERNNAVLDISYHMDFGKPISVRSNADLTTLQYLDNGLVKQKSVQAFNPVDDKGQKYNIDFAYNGENFIDVTDTAYFKGPAITRRKKTNYKYDNAGRLISAKCSDGQLVEIRYNANGMISSLNDHQKKEVLIEYDQKTLKPISVTRPQVGSIKLLYTNNGTIRKVQNTGGSTVNTQIYAAFNNFVDIVGPISTELRLSL